MLFSILTVMFAKRSERPQIGCFIRSFLTRILLCIQRAKSLQKNKKIEQIKAFKACKEYLNYVKEIETFIDEYDIEDEGTEYIDEMKPSINKSLQQFWSRLIECRVYAMCTKKLH